MLQRLTSWATRIRKNYVLLQWITWSFVRACLPVKHLALSDTGYLSEGHAGVVTQNISLHVTTGCTEIYYAICFTFHSFPQCILNHFRDHEVPYLDSFRHWDTLPTARLLTSAAKTPLQKGGVCSHLTQWSLLQGNSIAPVTSGEVLHPQWQAHMKYYLWRTGRCWQRLGRFPDKEDITSEASQA